MSPRPETRDRRGDGETDWRSAPGSADLNETIEHHRAEIDRTLSALEGKFSPGDMIDELLRSMNSGSGRFINNLGATVRDNPIPATLIGVGLGWLMLGQGDGTGKLRNKIGQMGSSDDDETPASAQTDVLGGEHHEEMSLPDLYAFCLNREYPFDEDEVECLLFEEFGPQAAAHYRARGGDEADTSEIGSGSGLGHKVGTARDEAKSRIDRTRLRMAAGSDEVRTRVAQARRKAMNRAKNARYAVSEGARRAKARTGDMVERYPLSVLALGVAAGAALGASMPSTQAEDRLMGASSDSVKKQAGDMARAKTDEAKRAAKAATTAARDEAREQGLERDNLIDKGLAVQERAREAAKRESAEAV